MDWGPRSPVIYTSVTEGDPDLKKPMALGVIDEDEVGLIITHSNEQITLLTLMIIDIQINQ